MYQPHLSPVAGSLGLSALVAAVPLLTLFVLLGGFRVKAHWAGLASLAAAVAVAVAAYGMPVKLTLLAASQGAAFGLFPIAWILFAAIWLYQLTVASGRFEDLRQAFGLVSDDPRIQAVIIAFCFGGLLEALAGFGAPVAITGGMLLAIGMRPVQAAVIALVADTVPVAFGAMAIPITTAGSLTKIPAGDIGAVVGRQTPLVALFIPLILIALVDGRRGLRQTWPAALTAGAVFAAAQFAASNYLPIELTDIIASLAGFLALVVLLRFWHPTRDAVKSASGTDPSAPDAGRADGGQATTDRAGGTGTAGATTTAVATDIDSSPRARYLMAFLPYLIVIAVFSLTQFWTPAKEFLTSTDLKIQWPGLYGHVLSPAGKPAASAVFTLAWLSSPGTLLAVCGLLVAVVYRMSPATVVREFVDTAVKLRWAVLTVAAMLALAYVMNLSGQIITIGAWIAGAGAAFAFLSPVLGWLGTAVSGSDTSANALFATLQQTAAGKAGLDPTLLVAANSSGGVVGKMISPQNLTVAAIAVGMAGRESELLRAALRWSLILLLAICLLVLLQSQLLAGMLP